jgi:predicted deacylase
VTQRDLLLMTAPLRDDFNIPCHEIGPASPRPAAAFVSGLHGDEINGVYILARLADFLQGVEQGRFPKLRLLKRVLIIPAVNVLGINTLRRVWPFDNSDPNRMFPGNQMGETTQRIAYTVLEATKQADYRIDIHSSNLYFEEMPQVRIYDPDDTERQTARLFGLPGIMERSRSPVFTTTLMYAWDFWPGQNFLLQVGQAGAIQLLHCQQVFRGLVGFLGRIGVLEGVELAETEEDALLFTREYSRKVYAERAGMFVSDKQVGRWVGEGQELGYIYDSFNGNVVSKVLAPVSGLLTGIRRQPMLFEGDVLLRVCMKKLP